MLNKAKVISVDGKIAVVEVERKSACDGCHKNQTGEGCSICTLTGGNRKFSAKALNEMGARVGDTVEIETASSRVLLYSALVFLLPVIVGIAFFFVAEAAFGIELYSYIALVGGFLLTFAAVWLYSLAVGKKRCDVVITRIFAMADDWNFENIGE